MKYCILVIGKPCSGKSAIGKTVARRLNLSYISSGDIARNMGDEITKELNAGKLAPENEMREAIFKRLDETDNDVILDGFPRTLEQLDLITDYCNENCIHIIYLHIYASLRRIISRSIIRDRDDDSALGNRLEVYYNNTQNVLSKVSDYQGYVVVDNDFDMNTSLEDAYTVISNMIKEN